MTLGEKQRVFSQLAARLILEMAAQGYEVAIAYAYRDQTTQDRLVAEGSGSRRSLHPLKLAIDLDLFKDGVYLTRSEDHARFGAWWKQQHPLCRWGGDFPKPDGNHYSVTHGGKA
jgi:hypothetical protein